MAPEDLVRRTFSGTNYALSTELGGAGDHIVPLATDYNAEADAITDYPEGISIMPVSGGANWGLNTGEAGRVITYRSGSVANQTFSADNNSHYSRTYSGGVWGGWSTTIFYEDLDAGGIPYGPSYTLDADNVGDALDELDIEKSGDKLATDAFAESTAITSYPEGISIMPVALSTPWIGFGTGCAVITWRTGTIGLQWIIETGTNPTFRTWTGSGWTVGGFVDVADFASHIHVSNPPLGADTRTESQAVTAFPDGLSIMSVSAGQNWGPTTGLAGRVLTERTGTEGSQLFFGNNGVTYSRTYTSGAWGTWVDLAAIATHAATHSSGGSDPITHNNLAGLTTGDPHTQYQQESEKAAANGYASLNASTLVPLAQQGSGTPAAGKYVDGAAGAWTTLPTTTVPKYFTFFYGDTLAVTTGVGRDIVMDAGTITDVRAAINTAPTGAAVNLSIKRNGTQFTTLSISAGANSGSVGSLSQAVAAGDYITVDVTQIGSTVAGSNLVVKVRAT